MPASSFIIKSGLAFFLCWFIFSANAQSGRFKRIDYIYDLVSNKVKEVSYQKDSIDQFIHKYNYDADNRITEVHTSTDGVIWDRDAGYSYYQHGPLSRIEIGDNKVQGIDYVYTLQGWIKSVNSNTLDATRDVGKDGLSISTGSGGGRVARDAYGYSLGYYSKNYKDYKPIGVSSDFIADITGSALDADNTSLYNGNIRHMVTALGQKQANGTPLQVQASVYRYDQLNSLKQVNVYALPSNSNSWASAVPNASYHEAFTYDENGNIQTLQRNGSQSQAMDALTYNYTSAGGKKINNKLLQVNDNVASNAYSTDIDDQGIFSDKDASTQNYGYDEIGNLIRDKQEGIASIEWTAAGKVRKITRAAGSTMPDLEFAYDGMGHRILKIEKPAGQGTAAWIITYYVHDATGNVLAVYKKSNGSTQLQEQSIYGASRLGTITRNVAMTTTSPSLTNYHRTLGKKQYELTNHLGNVLTTVSDRKLQHNGGTGTIDYYTADILSATDYYAFGSAMPERDFTSDNYRYGFNGMEKDNEVKGNGNSYTTEFRQYDPRLGRWLSIDPSAQKYPELSPYNSFDNNPICFVDRNGSDPASEMAWFSHDPTGYMQAKWNILKKAPAVKVTGGVIVVTAGIGETATGIGLCAAPTGISQAVGGTMVALGPPQIALGIAQIIDGVQGKDQDIPSSIPEMGGMVVDQAVGNNNNTFRKVGIVADLALNFTPVALPLIESKLAEASMKVATQFYSRAGWASDRIAGHLKGIDFNQSVAVTKLQKGTVLESWSYLDAAGNPKLGDYYSFPGADPTKMGIPLKDRYKITVVLQEDTEFLQSTANTIEDWNKKGSGEMLEGGEIQLFSPGVADKVKVKE